MFTAVKLVETTARSFGGPSGTRKKEVKND